MTPNFLASDDDATWWTDEAYDFSPARPVIALTAVTDGDPPDGDYVAMILRQLDQIGPLILGASERILDNYSYEHFLALGVDEALLVEEETPEAVSKVVTLTGATFEDPEGESFELSFSVPWDDEHSYDVTFEDGEATYCAVNG